jgi:hypothetical protein
LREYVLDGTVGFSSGNGLVAVLFFVES